MTLKEKIVKLADDIIATNNETAETVEISLVERVATLEQAVVELAEMVVSNSG